MSVSNTKWIAADWGTSNLRCWIMGEDHQVLKSLSSDQGMASLEPNDFEPKLLSLIETYLPEGELTKVIACGMVGAKQGWADAAYARTPCEPHHTASIVKAKVNDPRFEVHILPGICITNPPDVMRGEETQLAGFLLNHADFEGTICLPGTHAKWVEISNGQILHFTTCMTGELFATIGQKTILRHSIIKGWSDTAFDQGVNETLEHPEKLLTQLFKIRANDVLNGEHKEAAYSKLSGLLIGAELASTRPYWMNKNIVLIGNQALCVPYERALNIAGVKANITKGDNMVLYGLKSAYLKILNQGAQ